MAANPTDLLDRIRALERQVRELTGRAQMRPALNQVLNGTVVIGDGGQLYVREPDGTTRFAFGELTPGEFGVQLRRRDGTIALSIYNGTGDPDEPQVLRLFDAHGHEILSDDVLTGGLARPYLAQPWHDAEPVRWPSTTSTSFIAIQRASIQTDHPRLRVTAVIAQTGGSGAQLRLVIDGTTIATNDGNISGTYAVPNYRYGAEVDVELQARIAGTATSAYGTFTRLYGVGSA